MRSSSPLRGLLYAFWNHRSRLASARGGAHIDILHILHVDKTYTSIDFLDVTFTTDTGGTICLLEGYDSTVQRRSSSGRVWELMRGLNRATLGDLIVDDDCSPGVELLVHLEDFRSKRDFLGAIVGPFAGDHHGQAEELRRGQTRAPPWGGASPESVPQQPV